MSLVQDLFDKRTRQSEMDMGNMFWKHFEIGLPEIYR